MIGVAFIFMLLSLVNGVVNTKVFEIAERDQLQDSVAELITKSFNLGNEQAVAKSRKDRLADQQEANADRNFTIYQSELNRKEVAQVWSNGNFQRIKIYVDSFDPGSTVVKPRAQQVYASLAKELKLSAPQFAYIFVHGIVEPSEFAQTAEGREKALMISRKRADEVYKVLEQKGLIARAEEGDVKDRVPAKFAISYGTGFDLYIRSDVAKKQLFPAGRVDLVIFYKEGSAGK